MNEINHKIYIEPSLNFTVGTMEKLQRANSKRQFYKRAVVLTAALTPSLTREAWMFVRGDYFAVSDLPMGDMIAGAYRAFMLPTTGYALLVVATAIPITFIAMKFSNKLLLKKI